MHVDSDEISATVSIGAVHTNQPSAKARKWYYKIADKYLYTAKASGRNQVVWPP